MRHENLHREILDAALDEIIPGVEVAIDQPRCRQQTVGSNLRVGSGYHAGCLDSSNSRPVEENIARPPKEWRMSIRHDETVAKKGCGHYVFRCELIMSIECWMRIAD